MHLVYYMSAHSKQTFHVEICSRSRGMREEVLRES